MLFLPFMIGTSVVRLINGDRVSKLLFHVPYNVFPPFTA